jgi:hypothetical protein
MFIGEIEEVGVIEPVPETRPVEQPEAPVEEPATAR